MKEGEKKNKNTKLRLTRASLRHHFQAMDHDSMKQDQKRDGSFHFLNQS